MFKKTGIAAILLLKISICSGGNTDFDTARKVWDEEFKKQVSECYNINHPDGATGPNYANGYEHAIAIQKCATKLITMLEQRIKEYEDTTKEISDNKKELVRLKKRIEKGTTFATKCAESAIKKEREYQKEIRIYRIEILKEAEKLSENKKAIEIVRSLRKDIERSS